VATFYTELGQYSPCLHQLTNGKLCGIAKLSHTTGHFGQKVGEHDGPPPPPGVLPIITQRIKDLQVIVRHFLYLFFSLKTLISFRLILKLYDILGLDFRKQNQTKFRFIAKRTATKIS
jgi:hypothetical protein